MFARMRVRPGRLLITAAVVVAGTAAPAVAAGDVSAPVITRTVTGNAGEGGWFAGPVNVRWTVTDAESPWTSTGCDAPRSPPRRRRVDRVPRLERRRVVVGQHDGQDRLDAPRGHRLGDRASPGPGGLVSRTGRRPLRGHRRALGHRRLRDGRVRGARHVARERLGHLHRPRGQREPRRRSGPALRRHGPAGRAPRASRRPNRHGWYTKPVRFRFRARDALSGHARCAGITYRGRTGPAPSPRPARTAPATSRPRPTPSATTPPSPASGCTSPRAATWRPCAGASSARPGASRCRAGSAAGPPPGASCTGGGATPSSIAGSPTGGATATGSWRWTARATAAPGWRSRGRAAR